MLSSILLQIIQSPGALHDTLNKLANPANTQNIDTLTLFDLLQKGGIIMIPIVILSLLAVYIFFERLIAIKRASKEDVNFINSIRDMIYNMNLDGSKAFCKSVNTPVARMVEKGIERIGRPIPEIERAVESVGKFEISKLEKNLKILGIVAGIAPMLGFIGTILGVIKIFYNISLADNISIGLIAGGLYEKMITSASGLIVGVIAYAGYHYLIILLDKVIYNLENNGIAFMDLIQKKA
jgi:biopolymer transport protein ExbB